MRLPNAFYVCMFLTAMDAEAWTSETISTESAKRDEICGGCILPEQPIGGSFELNWSSGGLCNIFPRRRVSSGSFLNYTCKEEDGYILDGNPISFCHFNKWYLPPTCIKYCPVLSLEGVHAVCRLHGQIVSCEFLTAPGTKATLACKDSYKVRPSNCGPSNREIACLDGGVWSYTVFQCIPECGIAVADERIITANGSLVEHGSFPWHVAIYEQTTIENFEPICAGTLVSPNLVISAVHCFFNGTINKLTNASEISVVAGKYHRLYNISEHYSQKSMVERIDVPGSYFGRSQNFEQDIALIRLETPFAMTMLVRPVCMDWYNKHEKEQLQSGNSGMTARWGRTADGSPNDRLQEVHLPFISFEQCLNKVPEDLKRFITADKFCAGYLNGSRFCASDSGSGLYFLFQGVWFLRGITSLTLVSNETSDENFYSPFTNVGYFLNWIRDVRLSTGNGSSEGNDRDSDDVTYHNYDVLLGEYGNCPWRQLKNYSDGVAGLHGEIEDFFTYTRLTTEERELRSRVIRKIEDVMSDLWPKSKVLLFGSYRTGLLLPTSDIDLQVVGIGPMLPLQTLEKALLDRSIAKQDSIKVIDGVQVPIVKFTDEETQIELDISFENGIHTGHKSVELIESYKRQFPVLEKLFIVLKQFLVQRDLNKVYTGGISSYSLVLMTINFLQLHPGLNAYGPNANLGSLLIEFLELYGRKFDYVQNCIRVNDGGAYIPKKFVQCHVADEQEPSLLCIENPFIADNSVSCKSFRAVLLKEAFDQAYSVLLRAVSPLYTAVSDANKVSILGRIIRVPDDVVEYRKWIKGTFPLPGDETDSLLIPIGSNASTLSSTSDTDLEYSRGISSDKEGEENKKNEAHHDCDHQQPHHQQPIEYDKPNAYVNQ